MPNYTEPRVGSHQFLITLWGEDQVLFKILLLKTSQSPERRDEKKKPKQKTPQKTERRRKRKKERQEWNGVGVAGCTCAPLPCRVPLFLPTLPPTLT